MEAFLIRRSDYEDYDYREFWQDDKRLYEDISERIAIRKLLKTIKNREATFLDLGCGYGRLFNEYSDFKNIILVDYSIKNLNNAKASIERFLNNDSNKMAGIFFVSADVNNLPIKDSIVDIAFSVRLIHHLSDLKVFFTEVKRILGSSGLFIFEFANKRNLKNILRFLSGRIKASPFSEAGFQVGETILNYHPGYIKRLLKYSGFSILKKKSVSNFRLDILKRLINIRILIFFENLYQNIFSFIDLGPSIFFKTKSIKKESASFSDDGKMAILKPSEIFVCPYCRKSGLDFALENKIVCMDCKREFTLTNGVYDFKL